MDARKLGLILLAGGAAFTLLALVWFAASYADAMDMASEFAGDDYAARFMTCLYSSAAICQGAAMFSDGPAYSPEVFWIGVIALLGGIVVRLAASRGTAAGGAAAIPTGEQRTDGDAFLGIVPPERYVRSGYLLSLGGAAGGLLLPPLAVIALAGFGLALLGLTAHRPRLTALDVSHLGLIAVVFAGAALLLLATRGTILFLLVALAQIAAFYVGFNSYRHGRPVDPRNPKPEILLALRPGAPATPAPSQPEPQPQPDGDQR